MRPQISPTSSRPSPLLRTTLVAFLLSLAGILPSQADDPAPTGAFFNGVFPDVTPGTTSGLTTVNAFPNLRFIGPLWVTPYPGTNDLVVVGKSGHVWRFDNDENVMPGDVTVMLNLSKYGDGVDLPANVLPDNLHTPAVVNTPSIPSAPDMAFYNLTFHPNFGQSGMTGEDYVYTSYSYLPNLAGANNDQHTYFRVTRWEVWDDPSDSPDQGNIIKAGSETVLIQQYDRDRNHQGGAMFFGADGFLYISTGDGGFAYSNSPSERISQRLEGALMGGVLRIDVDMLGGGVSHAIPKQPDDSAMKHQPPAGWPASFSANYMIPTSNPWVGDPNVLEEFWAVGTRSPHTMQRDSMTGQIWIGDVGGGDEEIHLANAGDNMGWDYTNGGGQPMPSPLIGTDDPAILTIGSARCVIGGYIYRGTEFPDLYGKLLYGDHVHGTVSTLDYTAAPAVTAEFLLDFPRIGGGSKQGLCNFCEGPNGEVFMPDLGGFDDSADIEDNDGTIQKLAHAAPTNDAPALLSQTGAFLDLPTLTPHPAFLPYEVLAPLWSDNSKKDRWISLPNDGTHDSPSEQITFSEKDNWVFPAGTVLMKHFELPDDDTNPSSTVRLETRFIICIDGGDFYGVTYRWRPDQSEADLLINGETGVYSIAESGGGSRNQVWQFPSRSDCIFCHNDAAGQALGVRTHALNGDFTYPDGSTANQLLVWSNRGMFDTTLTPTQVADYLTAVDLDDTDVPVEHRARSYLDMNCAHCHRPGGPGGLFDARLSTPLRGQDMVNQTPDMFPDLNPDGLFIKPSDVGNSIIHYRMDHANPSSASMPPIAKNLVDDDAVLTVGDWINDLLPSEFPVTPTQIRATLGGPLTTTGDFFVTLVLDDDVSNLSIGDFSINNATVLELTGSCHYYRVKLRPTGPSVSISLIGGSVTGDTTGLPNNGSVAHITSFSDSEAPVATFTKLPVDGIVTGVANLGLDFNKDVTGLTIGDFTVTNGAISNLIPSNGSYTFDLTPTGGSITIDLQASAVLDSQSRPNAAASLSLDFQPLDTDGDGLADVDEATEGTNPTNPDSDGDGLLDGVEIVLGTDPNDSDSDNDGYNDGVEIQAGSDPNDGGSTPISNAPSSLVAYYNFDEGSGDTANDSATADGVQNGVRNQGTITWTTSNQLIGAGALDLNGSSSLQVTTDPLIPGTTTALTMCAWVNPDADGGYKGIFSERPAPGNWGLNVENKHFDARFANTTTSSQGLDSADILTYDATTNDGWFHLAIVWSSDGSTGTGTAYLNGVAYATTTGANVAYVDGTNTYNIGDDPCCGGREFDGRIDDLAVFDEALDAAAIDQVYRAGLQGIPIVNAFIPAPEFIIKTLDDLTPDGKIQLTWNSAVGATYSVLTTTDLSLPYEQWTIVYNNVESAGVSTSFVTPFRTDSPIAPQRFFVVLRN